MSECYYLELNEGRLQYALNEIGVPACVAKGALPAKEDGLEMVCRMGDPDILECVVYRREKSAGGIFALRDKNGPLLEAVATSNISYAAGLGHFGEMTANARYGVDVFENLEEPDD